MAAKEEKRTNTPRLTPLGACWWETASAVERRAVCLHQTGARPRPGLRHRGCQVPPGPPEPRAGSLNARWLYRLLPFLSSPPPALEGAPVCTTPPTRTPRLPRQRSHTTASAVTGDSPVCGTSRDGARSLCACAHAGLATRCPRLPPAEGAGLAPGEGGHPSAASPRALPSVTSVRGGARPRGMLRALLKPIPAGTRPCWEPRPGLCVFLQLRSSPETGTATLIHP